MSKQRYSRQTYQGVTLYFTRERIAREVAQVIRDFLQVRALCQPISCIDHVAQLHPDFYTDGAFHEWSMFSTIDNMALVGLRKVSRASIQIFLAYCPPPPTHI